MEKATKNQIVPAIIQVMRTVKGMEKNSTVGSGKHQYNGTKDADVKEVFNEVLANNGLVILPIDIEETTEVNRWTEETQYGQKQKQSVFTKVKTRYKLWHTSGEFIELAGYGHGVDTMDKGAGKATTYALKNCLLYTFLTPVGKIDDTDATHSEEIPQPAAPGKTDRWLSPENSLEWNVAIDKLQRGEKTLAQLRAFYKIRPEILERIKKEIS